LADFALCRRASRLEPRFRIMDTDFPHANALWAAVLAETLARKGVSLAVVSPGSRSAPLAVALARSGSIEVLPALDERSAAFFALGHARRTGCLAALLCTSGTAAANYWPAVVEASESEAPLVILTADRPARLRACGAGQTIDQTKLYGGCVRHFRELAEPAPDLERLRYLRQSVAWAVEASLGERPGPVHLNVPFDEPLAPFASEPFGHPLQGEAAWEAFFASLAPPRAPAPASFEVAERVAAFVAQGEGIAIAGQAAPGDPRTWTRNAVAFFDQLGWPVLCDALNPLRHGGRLPQRACLAYEFALRAERSNPALAPGRVLVVGELPTCKTLRSWLGELDPELLQLRPSRAQRDPAHTRSRFEAFSFERETIPLPRSGAAREESPLARAWREADAAALRRLEAGFRRIEAEDAPIREPLLPRLLARYAAPEAAIFVASSLPVRDAEWFWPAGDRGHRLRFSRGASGIDGTLSTAMGLAHGGPPTYLLTGDLAFLHDANGLLNAAALEGSLTVVLVNNGGGGIFEMLPVARVQDVFERLFATPQKVDFARLAAAHGVERRLLDTQGDLARALAAPPRRGLRLLEVATDRKADAALRKAWLDGVA